MKDIWDRRLASSQSEAKALGVRNIEASVPSVIRAYEERVRSLEEDKTVIKERMANSSQLASTFDETLRTSLAFLANP